MKLKPLPRMILILGVVSAVGYGASIAMKSMPSSEPTISSVPAPTVTTVDPKAAAEAAVQRANEAAAAAPAPTPAPPAPLLVPAPTNDAGLANVLGGKK